MVDQWLEAHAPGYDQLSSEERTAIKEFALIWSLFEAFALNEKGSAAEIIEAVASVKARGHLDIRPFAAQMTYFFSRYHDGAGFTAHFPHLQIRNNDHPDLVAGVLSGAIPDDESKLAVLLIIIYRLRNNLLHGPKWSYGIQGQLENFRHANAALMAYLERH